MTETTIESPLANLSDEEIEKIGEEFETIGNEVFDSLGDRDRRYIVAMIEMHRRMLVASRAILAAGEFPPALVAGTTLLSLSKILENMEIGHNVMHGQWDWMNDPHIHSSTWDWDTASTKEAWKHSHNYIHHTYTNIRGKDKDLGYEIMRVDPAQSWHPVYLLQPVYNLLLMFMFEWGVALHDLDLEAVRAGEKPLKEVAKDLKGIAGKARLQITKDYMAFPALSGLASAAFAVARKKDPVEGFKRGYKRVAIGNAVANVVRNVWAHSIIFCGHFPDQCYTFSQEEVENETKGGWYVRQLVGAANIEGSPMFHVASGNLGYQVEHHLYPDMPSTRYAEIAPRVKEVCQRWGLPYNTGPFSQQLGMVHRTIARLAFPGGKPRQKMGPYQGTDHRERKNTGEMTAEEARRATNGSGSSRGSSEDSSSNGARSGETDAQRAG
jgi:fatty acid desaturase